MVKGNIKMQNDVVAQVGLTALMNLTGPLKLPSVWPDDFPSGLKAKVPTTPPLDVEAALIEW